MVCQIFTCFDSPVVPLLRVAVNVTGLPTAGVVVDAVRVVVVVLLTGPIALVDASVSSYQAVTGNAF